MKDKPGILIIWIGRKTNDEYENTILKNFIMKEEQQNAR